MCFREAHPAHPRDPQSHVPGLRPQNLRPAHPAATSPEIQEGTLGTGPPPTAGPVCSSPGAWHTLEVGGEDEDLNALLTLPRSPWTRGCSLLSIPVCSCTFEAMGGVRRQTQGQVQANAGGAAGDEHNRAVHGEMRMEKALGVLGSRR